MQKGCKLRCPRHRLALAILLAASASATDAPAQSSPAPPTAIAPEPADDKMAETRRQFQAGVNLLEDPDGAKYEEAYLAFKKAHALSQSPKILGNIGFCAMHLERDGEAIDAYTAYLREAPDIDERERAQIRRDLETLSSTSARVRIVVTEPTHAATSFVLLDTRTRTRGEPVVNAYPFEGNTMTMRLRPGRHVLTVKAGNLESQPVETNLEPSSDVVRTLSAVPHEDRASEGPARRAPSILGPAILGAAGVVALGTGVTAGLLARNKTGDIEDRCPNNVCPAAYDLESNRRAAKTLGTVADISFVGATLLVGGAVLWVLVSPSAEARRTNRGNTATIVRDPGTPWTPSAMCTRDGCGLHLQGGF